MVSFLADAPNIYKKINLPHNRAGCACCALYLSKSIGYAASRITRLALVGREI